MSDFPCYGYFGRTSYQDRHGEWFQVADCKDCTIRNYCREAGDSPASRISIDNDARPVKDVAVPDKPDENREDAKIAEEIFVRLAHASNGNILRLGIVVGRICGMSYESIGRQLRISRQAVHKHIKAVAVRNPQIGTLLKEKPYFTRELKAELKTDPLDMDWKKVLTQTEKDIEKWTR